MGFVEKLRRPDWLAELQGLAALGAVAVTLVTGVITAATLTGHSAITTAVPVGSLGDAGQRGEPPAGTTIPPEALVEVTVAEPTTGQAVAHLFTGLPTMLVVLGILAMLWYVLRGARRNGPFTPGTVRQLRVLAVVTMAGGAIAGVVETIANLGLVLTVTGSSAHAEWQLPLPWLLAGFGFFAVAELVKRGTAMRTELAGVI